MKIRYFHCSRCATHIGASHTKCNAPCGAIKSRILLLFHAFQYEKCFPNGGASIFTFDIKGGQEEAFKFIDALELFSLLANVADVKSLVIHPASTTHSQLTTAELEDAGIYPNTIRLSIGTEHIQGAGTGDDRGIYGRCGMARGADPRRLFYLPRR